MQGSPPRRSRRRPTDERASFPLLPVLIGVVVLGFVIGAGLSLAGGKRGADAGPSPAPTIATTIPPAAVAAPSDEPTPIVTDAPTASPQPSHAPRAKPSPSHAPHAVARVTSAPEDASTDAPPPPQPAAPPVAAPATATPEPAESASPEPAPATPSAAPASPAATAAGTIVRGASTPFATLAANVVRVYLTSLGRGERDAAVAELATPPTGPLPEDGVVDGSEHIREIDVHGSGDVVTIDVDLSTASGPYAGRYTVERSPTGAALIAQHSLLKTSGGSER